MDARQDHIKNVIREKILDNQNPYLKCFIIDSVDAPAPHFDDSQIRKRVQEACDSLMDELGFRFKIEFQPECCFLKARKILPQKDELQKLRECQNYARLQMN